MADPLLHLTDRFGDWWQDKRGGVLPKLLYGLRYSRLGTEVMWGVALIHACVTERETVFFVLTPLFLIVFGFAGIATMKLLRKYQADFDRFDEEDVRKPYLNLAMLNRETQYGFRLTNLFIAFFIVTLNVLGIVATGRIDLLDIAPVAYFTLSVLCSYADCIIPKPPRVSRKMTRLVPLEVGSSS